MDKKLRNIECRLYEIKGVFDTLHSFIKSDKERVQFIYRKTFEKLKKLDDKYWMLKVKDKVYSSSIDKIIAENFESARLLNRLLFI